MNPKSSIRIMSCMTHRVPHRQNPVTKQCHLASTLSQPGCWSTGLTNASLATQLAPGLHTHTSSRPNMAWFDLNATWIVCLGPFRLAQTLLGSAHYKHHGITSLTLNVLGGSFLIHLPQGGFDVCSGRRPSSQLWPVFTWKWLTLNPLKRAWANKA